MATQIQQIENRFPQRLIQADGLVELALGIGFVVESETVGHWLNLNAELILITGIGVIVYGAWLLYMARQTVSRQALRIVGILNLALPVLCALVLTLDWNTFTNEGRWLIALVADTFLVLGLVELYSQRYTA